MSKKKLKPKKPPTWAWDEVCYEWYENPDTPDNFKELNPEFEMVTGHFGRNMFYIEITGSDKNRIKLFKKNWSEFIEGSDIGISGDMPTAKNAKKVADFTLKSLKDPKKKKSKKKTKKKKKTKAKENWKLEIPISGYDWDNSEYGECLSLVESELRPGVEYVAILGKPEIPSGLDEEEIEYYYPEEALVLIIKPKE